MGYSHYVWRRAELDLERWREWVGDVRQIVSHLPQRVPVTYYPLDGPPLTVQAPLVVTGPRGDVGRPELTDSRVALNGGGWADVEGRPQRLWCESFWLDRVLDTDIANAELPGEPAQHIEVEPDERGWSSPARQGSSRTTSP